MLWNMRLAVNFILDLLVTVRLQIARFHAFWATIETVADMETEHWNLGFRACKSCLSKLTGDA